MVYKQLVISARLAVDEPSKRRCEVRETECDWVHALYRTKPERWDALYSS